MRLLRFYPSLMHKTNIFGYSCHLLNKRIPANGQSTARLVTWACLTVGHDNVPKPSSKYVVYFRAPANSGTEADNLAWAMLQMARLRRVPSLYQPLESRHGPNLPDISDRLVRRSPRSTTFGQPCFTRSSSREVRIRVPFFSRGTLPRKRVKGLYWRT